ncbi:unnamed protein product, partial [Amoebophrya sp. A25]
RGSEPRVSSGRNGSCGPNDSGGSTPQHAPPTAAAGAADLDAKHGPDMHLSSCGRFVIPKLFRPLPKPRGLWSAEGSRQSPETRGQRGRRGGAGHQPLRYVPVV